MYLYRRSPERVKEFKDGINYVFSSTRYLEYFSIKDPDIVLCEVLKTVDGDDVKIKDNNLGCVFYYTEDIEPEVFPFIVVPEMCQALEKVEV